MNIWGGLEDSGDFAAGCHGLAGGIAAEAAPSFDFIASA